MLNAQVMRDPMAEFSAQLDVLNDLADGLRHRNDRMRAPVRLLEPDEVPGAYDRLVASVTSTVRSTIVLPLLGAPLWRQTSQVLEVLASGHTWHDIYDGEAVRDASLLHHLQQVGRAGARSRTLPRVPVKMVMVDDRRALVAISGSRRHHSLLIGRCGLLDDVAAVFDTLWSLATPVSSGVGQAARPAVSKECRDLLALLATGATDESIARQLGLSVRTVQRRMRRLEDLLGARTRFQAGLQAARRNLI